jgi:glycosyltransferase involved in cell wall biosynthesis
MLGWELPPFISGGLGTACHGLTQALSWRVDEILFLLPQAIGSDTAAAADTTDDAPSTMRCQPVPAELRHPYGAGGANHPTASPTLQRHRGFPLCAGLRVLGTGSPAGYGVDVLGKIERFADRCVGLVRDASFDVIHAHDWMTFPAGLRLAAITGKPLVCHIHATEFDRSGAQVDGRIYQIEADGLQGADRVIAVSHRTRQMVIDHYAVPAAKVTTIHNGSKPAPLPVASTSARDGDDDPVVLFLGRLTQQKGPGYFIDAAERVLEHHQRVKFVIAGWGDMGPPLVERVAAQGLSDKILFTGFLNGAEVDRAFRAALVYVMPSVSEPFGLTALEALRHGASVIVSRTSGVAEVLEEQAITVDCWDTAQMANHIRRLVADPAATAQRARRAAARLTGLTWDQPAEQCLAVYQQLMRETAPLPG